MTAGDRWFFARVAGVYDVVMPRAPRAALREGLAVADGPVDRLLDVGGGTGRAARVIDVAERVVLDGTAAMLRRVPPPLEPVLGDAGTLPVADGAVDAVVIADAFHHLPDQARALEEAHRVLRPGGVLVIREFDRSTIRGRLLELAEHAIGMESTFVTVEGLREAVAAAGFEASVLDRGFGCTVVGRKPRAP